MYYIGIDLGGTNIKGALVSETGEIAREVSRPTRVGLGAEAVCDGIAAVITELSSGVDRTLLGGVGLGCPGTVDDETGCVLYANNLGWKNFDLRAAVKSRTDFDLRIGNDANVAALAEALVGCAKGAQSAVIVTLGTGVGGGVVLDGKMLTGYTGAASELGHMVIRAGGEECTCGRRGCFEAYASATALIRWPRIPRAGCTPQPRRTVRWTDARRSSRRSAATPPRRRWWIAIWTTSPAALPTSSTSFSRRSSRSPAAWPIRATRCLSRCGSGCGR